MIDTASRPSYLSYMKHLLICREYPPVPGGGIGTYAQHVSRLLAESGETVHVIGQLWRGAEAAREEHYGGRLVVHRVPYDDWRPVFARRPSPAVRDERARALFRSSLPVQCFSLHAGALAERLVEEEGIDVVEAQDYEAPLYYFQARRALGLGPKRQPPCIVHLHSPTVLIATYNDWNLERASLTLAGRLERYSILAADALICPSRYLARQVEALCGVASDAIEVVAYPLGGGSVLERDPATWSNGSVCYLGRLERRKGVFELLEAAVATAERDPSVRFEFVGANVLGPTLLASEAILNQAVPWRLRSRFRFTGHVERSAIPERLANARIAVIPSRWENFPYTCIEAMASGLPVVASRTGGMAEMVADGETGWIADTGDASGLETALGRALGVEPTTLARMGRTAADRIRALCDDRTILARHLEIRERVVRESSRRRVPRVVPIENARAPVAEIAREDEAGPGPTSAGADDAVARARFAALLDENGRDGSDAGDDREQTAPYAHRVPMLTSLAALFRLVLSPVATARVWGRIVSRLRYRLR